MLVDPVRKVLITDAGHPVTDHSHVHTLIKLVTEINTVEECDRGAERVADNCDRRRTVRHECLVDVGEDRGCGAARRFCWMRNNERGNVETHLACSKAKPTCASTEDGTPGNRSASRGNKTMFSSVRRAKLRGGGISDGVVRARDNLHLGRVGALVGDNDSVL